MQAFVATNQTQPLLHRDPLDAPTWSCKGIVAGRGTQGRNTENVYFVKQCKITPFTSYPIKCTSFCIQSTFASIIALLLPLTILASFQKSDLKLIFLYFQASAQSPTCSGLLVGKQPFSFDALSQSCLLWNTLLILDSPFAFFI